MTSASSQSRRNDDNQCQTDDETCATQRRDAHFQSEPQRT